MSVRLSVRTEKAGSQGKDFHQNLILEDIFRKPIAKIQVR